MRARQVLDAVHGYIEVPAELEGLLDAPAVQRLRSISQTALCAMVFPSANGTRFEHSLGAMHLANLATKAAWDNSEPEAREALVSQLGAEIPGLVGGAEYKNRHVVATAVAAVGLLHDVGHAPFSHALEEIFRTRAEYLFRDTPSFRELLAKRSTTPFHELAGEAIVDQLEDRFESAGLYRLVRRIYFADPDGAGWASALHSLVSSTVDVDRLDYVIRDSHHAGTEYGAIDLDRLIGSLELRISADGSVRAALGLRARSAAELLLVQRMQAFRWMYQHPRVVAVECMLRKAVAALFEISSRAPEALDDPNDDYDAWAVRAIANLEPPLNYVRAASSYRLSGMSTTRSALIDESAGGEINEQLALPMAFDVAAELDVPDPSLSIFGEVQQAVTDDAIRGYASSAAICCSAAVAKGATDPALQRFVHYYDASLRRSSALVVPWKRHEEYAGIADQVLSDGRVANLLGELREANEERLDKLDPVVANTVRQPLSALWSDNVLLFNYLCYGLLHRYESQFNEMLTSDAGRVAGYEGEWHCQFIGRKNPLHEQPPNLRLEGGTSTSVSLIDSSPLVASVVEVERRSIKLYAFYLVTRGPRNRTLAKHVLRERLRTRFATACSLFLCRYLDESGLDLKGDLYLLGERTKKVAG